MTEKRLRTIVLGLPGVEERETWGHPTFRVKDRIFVGLAGDATTATIKTSKEEQAALLATDPATFSAARMSAGTAGSRCAWTPSTATSCRNS